MTPVERLFLTSLRHFIKEKGGADELRASLKKGLNKKEDWRLLLALGQNHGVVPILYHSLNEIGWTLLPDWVKAELKKRFLKNLARNLFLSSQMNKILEVFKDKGIICIPCKGVSLAEEVYPDISYRTSTDIDLLIPREDIELAEKILTGAGYNKDPFVNIHLSPENSYTLHLEKGSRSGEKSCVELHWDLAYSRDYSIPINDWWRSILQDSADNNADPFRMYPELTLLYLTINAHMSRYLSIKQFVDIAQVIKHYDARINWDNLKNMARTTGLLNNLVFTLTVVNNMFDIEICNNLKERFKSKKLRFIEHIFTNERLIRGSIGKDMRQFILFFLFDEKRKIIKSIIRVLLPSKEAVIYRYRLNPQSDSIYLYWLLNPLFSIYRLFRGIIVSCWAGNGIRE